MLWKRVNEASPRLLDEHLLTFTLRPSCCILAAQKGPKHRDTLMMGQTHLNGIDLHDVKGLETVTFNSAPHISIETFYRSKGIISDIFLRNAGVPDDFIDYIRCLVNQPIEYHTCFISYSNYDVNFAEQLHTDLQFYGIHSFFSPEDLKIGDKFWYCIDESIRLYDKLLVVLSEQSVSSTWVEREVMAALEKEQQQNTLVLLPIKLDEAVINTTAPWASDIRRSRHIGDFTHWQENYATYQKAFSRLLRDLQSNTSLKSLPRA